MTEALSSPVLLKECRHGRMAFLWRDLYIGRSLNLYGEFSEQEIELFARLVQPGMTVLEVGANIGTHTLPLARMVGPQGMVVAFEPQRVIFQLLCANLAVNSLFNVWTYQAGVGSVGGSLMLPPIDYAGAHNFGGVSVARDGAGEGVSVVPIDSLALPSAHLLKIDVEGMEMDVLMGARETIARHRPIIYMENDRQEKSPALIRLLDELGYRCWWHTPPLFNPNNFAGNRENAFPGIVSINLLCLPKEAVGTIGGLREVSGPADWFRAP